jgi:hypothetical protein
VTAPGARIVHHVTGRSRLRTRGMKGNDEYFAQVQSALLQARGVRSVEVNPRTESILIDHEGPIEDVLSEAERLGYLRLDDEVEEPYLAQINRAITETDAKLKQATGGRVDLETITFFGFLVGGAYQVANKHALPAGVTLLRYAVELVGAAGAAAMQKTLEQARAQSGTLPTANK